MSSCAALSEGLVDADRRAEGRLPLTKLGGLERTMAAATLEFCLWFQRRFLWELAHLLCHGLASRFPLIWLLWNFFRRADRRRQIQGTPTSTPPWAARPHNRGGGASRPTQKGPYIP